MKKLFAFLIFFTFSLNANESISSPLTTYVYNKRVNGEDTQATWTVEERDDLWRIQGENSEGSTLIIASPTQINTQSYSHHTSNSDDFYSIHREGTTLLAIRKRGGNKTEKYFSLGKETWVQEFDFTLKPYILSKFSDFKFAIVDPKKFNLHKLIATKKGEEQIKINGKLMDSIRVKVTLRGLKSMFWHADLWFEKQTGDLLKYESNKGPNTPTYVITLLSKQIE